MKLTVTIARIVVGCLFIFSGLVKAIDPLGLTYKMQEFFEVWGRTSFLTGIMHWLGEYAFWFSVLMITLEVALGVALLVGWRIKLTLRLLLLLIIFFTFLTSYVLFSGKIRACGCFGDCIPLTPLQTFTKDIILLLLAIILLRKTKYLHPLLKNPLPFVLVLVSFIATSLLQMHVVEHLPMVDCLPFKKGNNVLELRKMPADAVMDEVEYVFTYKKGDEQKEFTMKALPDSSWAFVSRDEKVVKKGKNNVPLINDFSLKLDDADSTEAILNKEMYYLLFIKNMEEAVVERWQSVFRDVVKKAKQKNIPIYVATSDAINANVFFNQQNNFGLAIYTTDATAIKTAARATPTIYVMKGPVVQNKYSWADFDALLQN